MATAVGGAVGTAIAGPVGGVIGGIIGGAFDALVMSQAFSKGANVDGARLDDLRVQLSSEGSPANRAHGVAVRIAGTLVWAPPLIERFSTQSAGGKGAPSGGSGTYARYFLNAAVHLTSTWHLPGGAAHSLLKVMANNKIIYDAAEATPDDQRYVAADFLDGGPSQAPHSLITAFEGSANVPAMRGSALWVVEEMDLEDWGSRPPNFEFLLQPEATAPTVGAVIGRELEVGGMQAADYDVSALSALKLVQGLNIQGSQDPTRVIEMLMLAYNIVAKRWGGKLHFYDRGSEPTYVLVNGMLGAGAANGEPRGVLRTRLQPSRVPREVNVEFFEASYDYQQSSRRAKMQNPRGEGVASLSLPLVLTGKEGHEIGLRTLWSAAGSSIEWRASLPPSFCWLGDNDVLEWEDEAGEVRRLRVTQVDIGANLLVRASGVVEQLATFDQSDVAAEDDREDGYPPSGPHSGEDLQFIVFDEAPLGPTELNSIGVYFAWASLTGETRLPAAQWAFHGGGFTYVTGLGKRRANTLGRLVDPLPAAIDTLNGGVRFDDETELMIEVYNNGENTRWADTHALQTRSREDVARGMNSLIIETDDGGHEVLSYTTAEDLGSGLWKLTGLLRGRRGTELHASAGASADVLWCSANELAAFSGADSSPDFANVAATTFGAEARYKAVNNIEDIEAKPSKRNDINGPSAPFPPVDVRGQRTAGGDLVIAFRRRTRALHDGFMREGNQFFPAPLEANVFEVDILVAGNAVRTLTVSAPGSGADRPTRTTTSWADLLGSGMHSVTYTAAMASADSVSLSSPVNVAVREVSSRGSGRETTASV